MGEFAFNRLNHLTQAREVAIVQAPATRQLPNPLDRVQLRAVGGQVIERGAVGVLFSPVPVEAGMVIFRVIRNDHDTPGTFATPLDL